VDRPAGDRVPAGRPERQTPTCWSGASLAATRHGPGTRAIDPGLPFDEDLGGFDPASAESMQLRPASSSRSRRSAPTALLADDVLVRRPSTARLPLPPGRRAAGRRRRSTAPQVTPWELSRYPRRRPDPARASLNERGDLVEVLLAQPLVDRAADGQVSPLPSSSVGQPVHLPRGRRRWSSSSHTNGVWSRSQSCWAIVSFPPRRRIPVRACRPPRSRAGRASGLGTCWLGSAHVR